MKIDEIKSIIDLKVKITAYNFIKCQGLMLGKIGWVKRI